jgi:putative ABC transport system permease protein
LKKNVDSEKVNAKLKNFIAKYVSHYEENNHVELGLQPYQDMYLHANFENGYISGGRIEYVRIFGIVAIFILLIAGINFMNLSTAQSLKRAKEIGVRKVIGANRSSLIGQFMGEAFLFTVLAVLLSLLLIVILLPTFNQFTGKSISMPYNNPIFGLFLVGITAFTGLFAGSYPALFLSGFRPIAVLKNNLKISSNTIALRKGLVVFQFTLSIVFIIGMIVISRQIDYIYAKNLGYQKDNLLYIPKTGTLATNYDVFKNEAEKLEGIVSLSNMNLQFTNLENTTSSVEWSGKTPNTNPNFREMAVGYDFIKTMKAELVAGREFSTEFVDTANYVINQSAMKVIGYEDPIGKPLTFWKVKGTIVGVVKDFHFNSLHKPIEPLIMRLTKNTSWGYTLIRTEAGKTPLVLTELAQLYKKLNPEFPFSYQFVQSEYGKLYESEKTVQGLSKYFAALAILISCLGLLGLVIFSTEQRTKEIGIRKVLGASVGNLWQLLSKDFVVLVMISCLIAAPIAYYFMHNWLQKYTYRTEISWWIFAVAGLGTLGVTLLTVSFQAIKAAVANPVKSLRTE